MVELADHRDGGLPRKLDGLQVGRAIAALSVVVVHASVHPFGGSATGGWHMMGRYGVTLFFVISGFIMMHTTGAGAFDARRFLGNRVRRVVPMYYLATAVMLALTLAAPGALHNTRFDIAHFLFSLIFVPHYRSGGTGMEDLFPFFKLGWTLNYEMFFYACFAALAFLGARGRAVTLTLFFGGLFLLGRAFEFQAAIPRFYTQTDTLGFVAGVWLGMLGLRGGFAVRKGLMAVLLVASIAGLVVLSAHVEQIRLDPWTQIATISICTIHVAALVTWFDCGRRAAPTLLVRLGDASYSMYLIHMFVVGAVTAVIHRLPPALLYPGIGVSILMAIGTGWLVYQLVERRLNRALRHGRPLTAAEIPSEPLPRTSSV